MTASKTSEPIVHVPPLKLRFYRQCRLWHGYLSAFAFVALFFFAVTGIALNHPDWFDTRGSREQSTLALTPSQVQALRDSKAPGELLTAMVTEQIALSGDFQDGALAMDQVFARLRGARGASDLRANLNDGSVAVTVEAATTVGVLNALHRGATAGAAWRIYIDILGAVLLVASLAGYIIFLSMSSRIRSALLITGASVVASVAIFFATVG